MFDGPNRYNPIIRKLCGMQQHLELFSLKEALHIDFNASAPPMAEHRGFQVDFEFSDGYVDVGERTGFH